MVVYTIEERVKIVQFYFENYGNVAECVRKLRMEMGRNEAPSAPYVRFLLKKLRETGTIIDKPTRVKPKTVRTADNIAAVAESVREAPGTSVKRRSQQLDISETSLRRILHKDLGMAPYKVQLVQELKPRDHPMRFAFAEWADERLAEDPEFYQKIIFSDEAHFHLGGYANKQNCRIWGTENPHVIEENPMHPQRVTVWCGFWAGGLIGPFFFENAAGAAVTVNGERYRAMLTDWFFPKIEEEDLENIWFQQDGAPCHTANATIDLVRTVFGDRIISQNSDVVWPPRSCDLTPLDYYLWGAVKDKCYVDKPATIQALKDNIRVAIAEIRPQTIGNVLKNWVDRMAYCKASRGSHMNELIFHT